MRKIYPDDQMFLNRAGSKEALEEEKRRQRTDRAVDLSWLVVKITFFLAILSFAVMVVWLFTD